MKVGKSGYLHESHDGNEAHAGAFVTHSPGAFKLGAAVLEYKPVGHEAVIDIHHTNVPPEARGQGAAEKLCDAAYAHARSSGLKILPTCSYVRDKYVPEHLDHEHVGTMTLRAVDAGVPGLQIETALNGVATLRLTEARRRNPLTEAILSRMREWLQAQQQAWPAVGSDGPAPDVRSIVLESSGPVFSSGHCLKELGGADAATVGRVLELCTEVSEAPCGFEGSPFGHAAAADPVPPLRVRAPPLRR